MKLAVSVDLPFSEFWEMTPYELNLKAQAYQEKQKNRFKEKISLEYYNAMWTIQWLGEKKHHPKPLKDILKELDKEVKEKRIMTDEEMLNQVMVLNMIFGGDTNIDNPLEHLVKEK